VNSEELENTTNKELSDYLQRYQDWRRGADERTMEEAGIVPRELGQMLDLSIKRLSEDGWVSLQHGFPETEYVSIQVIVKDNFNNISTAYFNKRSKKFLDEPMGFEVKRVTDWKYIQ